MTHIIVKVQVTALAFGLFHCCYQQALATSTLQLFCGHRWVCTEDTVLLESALMKPEKSMSEHTFLAWIARNVALQWDKGLLSMKAK